MEAASKQSPKLTRQEAGRLGGLMRSEAKAKAVAANGVKGGRPKTKPANNAPQDVKEK